MKPPVWRRLDVRSDLSLEALHLVLQAAFEWEDSHLHHFHRYAERGSLEPDLYISDVEFELEGALAEHEVTLDQVLARPGETLGYTYDLGDDWSHTLKLEKVLPLSDDAPPAVLLTGRQSAPFEDGMGFYDDDGQPLDEPREREFDLDELRETVAALFEDDDDVDLFDISDELVEEIGAIAPGAIAAAARANPLVVRLRAGLGLPSLTGEASPGAEPSSTEPSSTGVPETLPARHREVLRTRDERALAVLASTREDTTEARQVREELAGDETGAAAVLLIAYLTGVVEESVPLSVLMDDPKSVADRPEGLRAVALLELIARLGAEGLVDIVDAADTSVDAATVVQESALLAAAGLAALDSGRLRLDPDLRPVLLMALSGLVGATDDEPMMGDRAGGSRAS